MPYNLCLLAAALEPSSEVTILDAFTEQLSPGKFQTRLRALRPELVGITIPFDPWSRAGHQAAALIKSELPETRVAVGGVYPTVNPERAMRDANVDYAFVGEGDRTLPQLVAFLADSGTFPDKGVWFRENGQVVARGRADAIECLDELPRPALHLVDYPAYANAKPAPVCPEAPSVFPNARIFSSRGCPCGCTFCQVETVFGRRFRGRSAAGILDEIAWLKERYGIRSLTFDDDNLHSDRQRALDLFRGLVKRGLAMPWKSASSAFFRLDPEQMDWMRESGCVFTSISVESGCERIRRGLMGKPGDLRQAARVTRQLQDRGIYVATNVILGFPTETWAEVLETLRVVEDLGADYVRLFLFVPLPHTKAREKCVDLGLIAADAWWDDYGAIGGNLPYADFTAADLAIVRAYEWDRINFTDPQKRRRAAEMMQISLEALDHMRAEARLQACRSAASRCAEADERRARREQAMAACCEPR